MKILLCAINSKFIHSSLAVWYLKSAITEKCPDAQCHILEGTVNESTDTIYERLKCENYDLICFSVYIWNKRTVYSLTKRIDKSTGTKILLGGPEVSYNAEEIFCENEKIDYIISGEGELPITKLVNGISLKEIEGLCYKMGGGVVIKEPFCAFSDPPNPYTEEYLGSLNGRIAYLETSRGCPFRCAFCLSGRCGGVHFFDTERSKRDILLLANSGAKTVKLIDRSFNADRKRAREILSFIINSYGNEIPDYVRFHFEIEGELLDEETFDLLKKAPRGVFQFEIGVQSFNEKTLRSINRNTSMPKLKENIRRLIQLGNIHIHLDLIAGLPCEDTVSFGKGVDSALELKPHKLQLGFLKLLHGAEMRESKDVFPCEFSSEPPYEILSSDSMTQNDIKFLKKVEDVFEKLYNSKRFIRLCDYLLANDDSMFSLLCEMTRFLENKSTDTLDNFSFVVFEFLTEVKGLAKATVRDLMALDRLSSNRMGYLPEFLRVHSPKIKEILNQLDKNEETKRQKGIKRAATLLLCDGAFVYVDYINPDKVSGQYTISRIMQKNT